MQALSPEHFHCRHPHHLRPSRPDLKSGPQDPSPQVGLDGMGDPYFSQLGNGGYDALHYDLNLKVKPEQQQLEASATMQAKATQNLKSFNLDFHGFDIQRITVNGQPAQFERPEEGELVVQPKEALAQGQEFQVKVDYAGKPESYNSPYAPIPLGWNSIQDGSYVLSEPDGASHWFPVNDHPRDKASYTFTVTVPDDYQVVCNGDLLSQRQQGAEKTYVWDAKEPMASYLATVNVGKFVEEKSEGPDKLPILNFYPPNLAAKASHDFGRVPEMLEWFSERYGKYPFSSFGNLVINASVGGAALETQTRPIYERGMVSGDRSNEYIYAHELAHQWWGNNTSVQNWKDIWLNEGFANYSHMQWKHEHDGGMKRLDRAMHMMYFMLPRHTSPVADPGKEDMFSENVYNRGAVTLHLLRKDLGDETFFRCMRTFQEKFHGQNVTTSDFVATVNEVSGKDKTEFFHQWVEETELPPWPKSAAVDVHPTKLLEAPEKFQRI